MADGMFILDVDADGSVASHPSRTKLPVMVAPIPEEDKGSKFDTLRPHLVATGCMGVPNRGFEFDSSFLNPNTQGKFTKFVKLMKACQSQDKASPQRLPPVSVFGHTDPTGTDDYNKTLSGRRALAVYGLLIRNADIWDELFLKDFGGDRWGIRSIRFMLSKIKRDDGTPFFDGAPEDTGSQVTQQTRKAIADYEAARGGKGGGSAMPSQATRKKMYLEYMDILCHDEAGKGFKLDPVENFLAKKKDAKYRGDVQGCSRFNPILLLSSDEDKYYNEDKNKDARNELYAPDRRVLIYIFEHDSEVDPGTWPCPEARSGAATCRKRFWSDSDRRLKPGDDRREFKDQQDTMACRFYHGFAHNSPCETGGRLWIIRFQVDAGKQLPVPLRNRRYVLWAGSTEDAPVIRGTLDAKGEIRIPVFDEKTTMTLKIDARDPGPPPKEGQPSSQPAMNDKGEYPDEDKFFSLVLDAGALGDPTDDLGAKQRLYNMGYGSTPPDSWKDDELKRAVKGYRSARKLGDGALDDSKDAMRQEHELNDVPADDPDAPGPVASSGSGGSSAT